MKIWLMTTEYPPYFGGGIATYGRTTVESWVKQHHEVTVIVRDPELEVPLRISEKDGVRLVRFSDEYPAPHRRALTGPALMSYLFSEVVAHLIRQSGPPDILESQDYVGIAYFLLQRKRSLEAIFHSVPVVITIHGPKFIVDQYEEVPLYHLPDYWTRMMEKFSLMAADQVVAPSHYVLEQIQHELPNLHARVIPNPYALPGPDQVIDPLPTSSILYFGRVQRLKGIMPLLEAMSYLWEQGEAVTLHVVVGDSHFYPRQSSMKTLLEKTYAQAIDEGRLVFHGLKTPEEVATILRSAGLVIVPSYFENLPYAVLEPMAYQRVVMAAQSGGQRDVIRHGESGFLFSHGSPLALSQSIQKILALPEEEWKRIGRKARESVEMLSNPLTIAEAKEALFSEVIASHHRKTAFPFVSLSAKNDERMKESPSSPLLSAVVPYYNLGEYIKDTVESLLASTLVPDEILIVNDGSTEIASIAKLYLLEERYEQVRVLRRKNAGLAASRNVGAKAARGKYVAFLDADDIVSRDYYARAVAVMEHYPNVAMVGAWAQYFGEPGNQTIWPTWNTELPYLLYHNTLNSSALVMRRDLFLRYSANKSLMAYGMEDWEAVVSMVEAGYGGVAIPEPLFHYRIRPDSMSHGFNRSNVLLLYQFLSHLHAPLYEQYAVDLANLFNANGPQYRVDTPMRDPLSEY